MNVMLDLETMGTGAHSAIVAIGAVVFDNDGLGQEFYQTIDLASAVEVGDIDANTVVWWMKQSEMARSEIYNAIASIDKTLMAFSEWLPEDAKVWGNGSDFDNLILSNAYKSLGMPQPWRYRNNRCFRTVKAMNKELNLKRLGVHHNALDDAIYQANYLLSLGIEL